MPCHLFLFYFIFSSSEQPVASAKILSNFKQGVKEFFYLPARAFALFKPAFLLPAKKAK